MVEGHLVENVCQRSINWDPIPVCFLEASWQPPWSPIPATSCLDPRMLSAVTRRTEDADRACHRICGAHSERVPDTNLVCPLCLTWPSLETRLRCFFFFGYSNKRKVNSPRSRAGDVSVRVNDWPQRTEEQWGQWGAAAAGSGVAITVTRQ